MKESNLYISNLPRDITERDLDRIFGEYGEIIQRNVLKDKITGLPRGVAFVRLVYLATFNNFQSVFIVCAFLDFLNGKRRRPP